MEYPDPTELLREKRKEKRKRSERELEEGVEWL